VVDTAQGKVQFSGEVSCEGLVLSYGWPPLVQQHLSLGSVCLIQCSRFACQQQAWWDFHDTQHQPTSTVEVDGLCTWQGPGAAAEVKAWTDGRPGATCRAWWVLFAPVVP